MSSSLEKAGLPPEVSNRLQLAKGDRILAYAPMNTGWLIGTRHVLAIVAESVELWPWEQLQGAQWDQETAILTVEAIGEFGQPRPRVEAKLDNPRRFLQLVRERITATVVIQRRFPIDGEQGFRVIARRSPATGEIEFMVEFDPGVNPEDERISALAQRGISLIQGELGL